MITGYYCAIFPFCGVGKKKKEKKKDDKKTEAFYDWATTGIPVNITSGEEMSGTLPKYIPHVSSMQSSAVCSQAQGREIKCKD